MKPGYTLHAYQEQAVARMVNSGRQLVAYGPGLGKTVITIEACERLMEADLITEPVLVVVLSSLKYQWAAEIRKFSESAALVIDGTPKKRAAQWATAGEHDYVVVNYEALRHDWEQITARAWGAIVSDESHALKSFRAQRSKRAKLLAKFIPIRFALTGTPVENGKAEELYSIMQFVDPAVLGKFWDFDKAFIVRDPFGGVSRYKNLPALHAKMSTAMIRKTQSDPDVAPYLPDEIHREPLTVKMTPALRTVYKLIVKDLLAELENIRSSGNWNLAAHYGVGTVAGGHEDNRGDVMAKVTALRMLVQHPGLLLASNSKYVAELLERPKVADALTRAAASWPKLKLTGKFVADHLSTDEAAKAVVFSTYLGMVDLLAAELKSHGIESVTYTGRMNSKAKQAAKVKFQTDPNVRVLISSDAGGYGVDLPQANLLVNYDLPWSSGASQQRNARIRRASSTWPSIIVQDILVAESIEERVHAMLAQKDGVADAIVDGRRLDRSGGFELTLGSLREFLTR